MVPATIAYLPDSLKLQKIDNETYQGLNQKFISDGEVMYEI